MIGKVNLKFGDCAYQFEIDEKSEMDTLHKTIVLGNPPRKCDECGATESFLDTNKDKEGNTYINAVCGKCKAKAKLGQYKTGGFFWHKYEQWQNTSTQPTPSAPAPRQEVVTAKDDEIDIDELDF